MSTACHARDFAHEQTRLQLRWDLAVIDEAHKLRNVYRSTNKIGRGIKWALDDTRKLLLTATPLQNSLLELYGLALLIDDRFFGGLASFRSQYTTVGADLDALKNLTVEKALSDTKAQLKALKRQATTTDAQHALQQKIHEQTQKQRRQRQEIFDAEDQIQDKRDALIGALSRRLTQSTTTEPIFTLRWSVL